MNISLTNGKGFLWIIHSDVSVFQDKIKSKRCKYLGLPYTGYDLVTSEEYFTITDFN